jgi:hypothetical protein
MAYKLLKYPSSLHEVSDDIESFIWVLFRTAGRYAGSAMSSQERDQFLKQFDYYPSAPEHWKGMMLSCGSREVYGLARFSTAPFRKLLGTLTENLCH